MVNDDLLERLRQHPPGAPLCLLDGTEGGWAGLYHSPIAIFRAKDGQGTLVHAGGETETITENPFRFLSRYLRENPDRTAAGYWSYDLRYCLERLPRLAQDDLGLPDCWVGLYEGVGNTGWGLGATCVNLEANDKDNPLPHPPEEDKTLRLQSPIKPPLFSGEGVGGEVAPPDSMSRTEYERAVDQVLEYIAAGDCYQVNLSHRLAAPLAEEPWQLYERLRRISPVPYGAYLDCGDHQVLSASPELFLRIRNGRVETHPIKGTRPRGRTPEEDAARAAELLSSAKDRAELLMIVDLERNDLGKVCRYGTVQVPDLFRLESYSNVHHLVATVTGQLRPEVNPLECLAACFPGGSITGAPKIRAMEIIEELEPVRRGIYTGAIGWVDGRGNAEWNIAIRTMVVKDGTIYFSVGGGIVADSQPAAEYEETLAKARSMREALGRVKQQGSADGG